MIRLGKRGYRSIMLNLTRTADYLAACLRELGFLIMSQGGGRGLPLVAFRLDPDEENMYDEFALAHQLRERGWVVPAYTMAPHSDKLKLMRVVVREDFSKARCDSLVGDIKLAKKTLDELDESSIAKYSEWVYPFYFVSLCEMTVLISMYRHIHKNSTNVGKSKHNHPHYKNEGHSLAGKHGKTHAVC
jgi:glutamate decarboxylase